MFARRQAIAICKVFYHKKKATPTGMAFSRIVLLAPRKIKTTFPAVGSIPVRASIVCTVRGDGFGARNPC